MVLVPSLWLGTFRQRPSSGGDSSTCVVQDRVVSWPTLSIAVRVTVTAPAFAVLMAGSARIAREPRLAIGRGDGCKVVPMGGTHDAAHQTQRSCHTTERATASRHFYEWAVRESNPEPWA